MNEIKEIPVYLLNKLEEDRIKLYSWLETIQGRLSIVDIANFISLTSTMWEVANREDFRA